jgi:hypothetical protein
MSQNIELISLSELIAKVKSDLLSQVKPHGLDTALLFVDEISITAQVIAKREQGEGGKAGLKLSVLGLGANAGIDSKTTVAHELTQNVTLKLSPLIDKTEYVQKLTSEQKNQLRNTIQQGVVRGQGDGTEDIA